MALLEFGDSGGLFLERLLVLLPASQVLYQMLGASTGEKIGIRVSLH
jgi:hypothetical protein